MALDQEETYLKLLIYGNSGTGKTTIGTTMPRPFFLLSERQGYRAVSMAARRIGVERPPVLFVEKAEELRTALSVLRVGGEDVIARVLRKVLGDTPETQAAIDRLPYTDPQSIVADSFTDFCRLVSQDIMGAINATASDGQETRNDRYWDLLRSRSEGLMTVLRDLPYHVMMLCLLDDRTVGEKKEERQRRVSPDTPMRALPNRLLAATNACGISYVKSAPRENEQGDTEYTHTWGVRFKGPNFMMLKSIEPLGEVEEPNASDWILRVLSHDAHSRAAQQRAEVEPPQDAPAQDAPAQQDENPRGRRAKSGEVRA